MRVYLKSRFFRKCSFCLGVWLCSSAKLKFSFSWNLSFVDYLEFWLDYIFKNWIGIENSSSKWFQYTSTVIYNRELCHKIWSKGPFNNYVDQIYPILTPPSPPPQIHISLFTWPNVDFILTTYLPLLTSSYWMTSEAKSLSWVPSFIRIDQR